MNIEEKAKRYEKYEGNPLIEGGLLDGFEWIINDYYGGKKIGYIAKFASKGLTFTKELSYPAVCDPFKLGDGSYAFTAKIAWIDNRNRTVRFGGRLSKTKVRKGA